ncbi:MAG: S8 family serine peptidase [Vulcanimicrobiaceae bacterium]
MRFKPIVALIAVTSLLSGCGGGGSSVPSTGAHGNSAQQVAVQQSLVNQSLATISAVNWVAQLGNPSSPSLFAVVRRTMSGTRQPQSCTNGIDVTTTGSATSYTVTIDAYYNTDCTGQLAYAGQLSVTQTSTTLATAAGSYSFYTPSGTLYEYLGITKLAVSTASGSQYFSLQATASTSQLSPPYQALGIGCTTATTTELCSLAVIDHVAATATDNATIDSATIVFSTSGSNTLLSMTSTGSDFTGPLNSTGIVQNGQSGFLIAGGTLVDSVSLGGSFTFSPSGFMSAANLTVNDGTNGAKVTVAFSGTSFSGTIAGGGTTLASFTVDASGTGTVTYSDGTTGTIANFAVVTGPHNSTSFDETAFACPTSYTISSSAHGASTARSSTRRMPARTSAAQSQSSGLLAVVYNRTAAARAVESYRVARAFDYPALGRTIHVLAVPPAQQTAAIAALRAEAGVLSVAPVQRRYALTSTPYLPNDPYFDGFSPANVAPLYESAALPGQWDMHVIGLENAFGYSTTSNALGTAHAGALGSHSVKLAIVDSGEDPTHPDLGANIVYQKCFITNPVDAQSTSSFSTDPLGHGTDVSGIAAAVTGNGLGFAGAGGNTGILAYRVFPTPSDDCATISGENDPQCGASTVDIAAAIDDAVSQGANIISMSIGGGSCTSGVDGDPLEGAAVQNAIASHVVVIAASGNSATNSVDAPACDTGVIAVGATALDDGQPNSTGHSGGTSSTPVEYVPSYSNYGSPNTWKDASSWGIVAPGGDPSGVSDADNLHWIENIWTSTPYMSSATDATFAGSCSDDYPNESSSTPPVDCRTLIAGTSMSAPHVAGVAALVLGVSGATYQDPAAMKTLLCATADNIGGNQGCGRLNAYRAVATALGDPSPP